MINIYYWFVDKESGEDFFVEVKSTNTRGDDYSDGIAWQIAKCNFGDNVSLVDIVDGEALNGMALISIKREITLEKILDKST